MLSDKVMTANIYRNINWELEISKFWNSVDQVSSGHGAPPLFAYALAKFFKPVPDDIKLTSIFENSNKFIKIQKLISTNPSEPFKPLPLKNTKKITIRNDHVENIPIEIDFPSPSKPPRGRAIDPSVSTDRSRISVKHGQEEVYGTNQLPPISHEQENANFALSKVCGPSNGSIRVMDVKSIPETGQYF